MKVFQLNQFEKEFKQLQKKYPKILLDVREFKDELIQAKIPIGDKVEDFGGLEIYKARIKNSSANRGKSGGFRIIYYIKINEMIALLSIYSKSDKENLEDKEKTMILKNLKSILS